MNRTETCANCIFREPDQRAEYSKHGECRRFPPQVAQWTHPEYNGPQYEQHWPWMHPDSWCGEYQPAPEELPEQDPIPDATVETEEVVALREKVLELRKAMGNTPLIGEFDTVEEFKQRQVRWMENDYNRVMGTAP